MGLSSFDGPKSKILDDACEILALLTALPPAGTYARFQHLIFSVHDTLSGHDLWGESPSVAKK